MLETLKSKMSGFFSSKVAVPVFDVNALTTPTTITNFNGDKFFGGFGFTELQITDYHSLRLRSNQLFNTNLYARGLLRRLITNEINTGLSAESIPDEKILGLKEESLQEWNEDVENRFNLWGKNKNVCDYRKRQTFGGLQRSARLEALLSGDVLAVLRMSPVTRTPMVQLIPGDKVQSPIGTDKDIRKGNKIFHGVETNAQGRIVAHWVRQDNLNIKRLPAIGEKSGRIVSWLIYGTDKRIDDLRGVPLLGLVLQSLKEVDRYRDSTQRKATINSMLAIYMKKTEKFMGSKPNTGGAVRRGTVTATDLDGSKRTLNVAEQIPGVVFDELQYGEEPVSFGSTGTDEKFGTFEEAIIQAVAWANEVPPEILRLAFSNNYSASQAAINEFKIYLNKIWSDFGESFCQTIHTEWLLSEVLNQKIIAPGLLDYWRDKTKYDLFGAYTATEWYGSIKPSTDMLKQAKGSKLLIDMALTTHTRESRNTTGTSFNKNVKRLKREIELLLDARKPLVELEAQLKQTSTNTKDPAAEKFEEISAQIEDLKDEIEDLKDEITNEGGNK